MSDTTTVTPASWAMNIRAFASEGRLRQNVWNNDDSGRHIACILGAASTDIHGVGDVPCAALCMPQWLAALTPNLFDGVRQSRATEYALRYADVIDGWCVLSPRAWRRIELRFKAFCVRQGLKYAETRHKDSDMPYWAKVKAVCEATAALFEEQAGEVDGPGEAAHPTDAAYAARAAALAADAARAAALAADAADAARAAALAADAAYAARAAALAAYAAYAARAAALAARAAALAADAALAALAALEEQFDRLIELIGTEIAAVPE